MSIYWHFGLSKWSKFYEENQLSFWAQISSKFMWEKMSRTPPLKSNTLGQSESRGTPLLFSGVSLTKWIPSRHNLSRVFQVPPLRLPHFQNELFWLSKMAILKVGYPTFETGQKRLLFDAKFWQKCSPWKVKIIARNLSKIRTSMMTIKPHLLGGWYPLFRSRVNEVGSFNWCQI